MIEQLIEIEWNGGFSCAEVATLTNPKTDFGVYCIYGTHAVMGPETLLYIGKACNQTFAARFLQHKVWLDVECGDLKVFVERIGSSNLTYTDEVWTQKITHAENLLIHYLSPPYNTTCIYEHPATPKTLILNFNKRYRLPYCIASTYYQSDYYKRRELWKPHEFNDPTCA